MFDQGCHSHSIDIVVPCCPFHRSLNAVPPRKAKRGTCVRDYWHHTLRASRHTMSGAPSTPEVSPKQFQVEGPNTGEMPVRGIGCKTLERQLTQAHSSDEIVVQFFTKAPAITLPRNATVGDLKDSLEKYDSQISCANQCI